MPSPQLKRTDSFSNYDELENFSLTPPRTESKEEPTTPETRGHQRLEEMQKRSKEREEARRNKGLAGKMKAKLQEQIKAGRKQLEEKEKELE